ncbi:MAG: rhodanese-related sulfurtransferase [Myxococcota bacterium]
MVSVLTFYRFGSVEGAAERVPAIKARAAELGLRGLLAVSPEGANATLAGERTALETFVCELEASTGLRFENRKWSAAEAMPFKKLRVYFKERLLAMRVPCDPATRTGTYVKPKDWNALIERDEVTVIDVRNWYEVYAGTFEGAVDPKTETFNDFEAFVASLADRKDKPVAMFCTGGIRCEVATSYMLKQGFESVFHLEGGILKYLEEVAPEESRWRGECFVFDERVSVDHRLQPGTYERCRGCTGVLSEADRQHPHYEAGVSCARCYGTRTPERVEASRERVRQLRLAEARLAEARRA